MRVHQDHPDARVVELADSLDSGSSVQYGRAGSSPASRTKTVSERMPFFLSKKEVTGKIPVTSFSFYVLIKRGIEIIDVFLIHLFLCKFDCFAKYNKMEKSDVPFDGD